MVALSSLSKNRSDNLLKCKRHLNVDCTRKETQKGECDVKCANKDKTKSKRQQRKDEKDLKKMCFVCRWVYPKDISMENINVHLNLCLEGKGEEHKTKYYQTKKIKEMNDMPLEENNYEHCPICGKELKMKNVKIKMYHVTDCMREFQERDWYSSTKKRNATFVKSGNYNYQC